MSGIVTTDWPARCTTSRRDGASVADVLEVPVNENPDKAAIICEGSTTTYRALDQSEHQKHCRETLAAFKCPKFVVRREQIPKSASGNIFKKAICKDLIAPEVS